MTQSSDGRRLSSPPPTFDTRQASGYRSLTRNSGTWALNLLTDELVVSPNLHVLLGFATNGPFKAGDFFASLHPDDLEATSIAFALATHSKVRAVYDVRYRAIGKGDGLTRWVAAKGRAVFDAEGFCLRAVGTVSRIDDGDDNDERAGDDRASNDATLATILDFINDDTPDHVGEKPVHDRRWFDYRGQRIRFPGHTVPPVLETTPSVFSDAENGRRAWNILPELLSTLSRTGILLSVNPAWLALLGLQTGELLGQRLRAFVHPDDADAMAAALAGAVAAHLPGEDIRMLHKDGSLRWIRWSVSSNGPGLFASGQDNTAERKAAENAARAETLLRHDQKMEAIGQLAGGIAHDFNNLLQALSGGLELLGRRHVHAEAGQQLLRRAAAAIERGSMLTEQLLCFSGKQHLASQAIDVNGLIAIAAPNLSRLLEGVEIIWTSDPLLWSAMADPNQLDVALLNLLQNARDAMPDGGVIRVATRNLPAEEDLPSDLPPGDYVSFAVTDTGVGMSHDILQRAIEPFFTTKGLGRGTGLGLSQVYGFARQSGGTLRLTSAPGQGTMVEVLLPRAPLHLAETPPASSEPLLRPKTILVVDDDQDVRELTVAALEDCGYRVLEAEGGVAGLALMDKTPIDLLIVDFAMPVMTGAEMVRLARERSPGTAVIFMTGYADLDALREFAAPEDIIRKPFRLATLTEHVAAVTARSLVL